MRPGPATPATATPGPATPVPGPGGRSDRGGLQRGRPQPGRPWRARSGRAVGGEPCAARAPSAPQEVVGDQRVLEDVQHVERLAGPERHAVGGVLGDDDRDAGRAAQQLVEVPQQRAAARHDDPAIDHVADQLGGRQLQHPADAVGDLLDRLLERLDGVLGADGDRLGKAVDQIAAAHLDLVALLALGEHGGADPHLDLLGGTVADQQVLLVADVADDRLVELVAGDAQALAHHDSAQADDGDVRRAPADVDDHRAGGLGDVDAGPDGGGQRLLDQERLACADLAGRLQDGATLDLGHAGGDAHHDVGPEETAGAGDDLAYERLEHLLGQVVVGDHAVPHRPDGGDVARRAPQHAVRLVADRLDLAGVPHHGDHGRLAEHDALALDVDEDGGRPQVDADLLPRSEHPYTPASAPVGSHPRGA